MPIYEYECIKCGTHMEALQKITDSPLKKCQSNGCMGRLRRLMSNSSFVLKGSGWYVTDYPSDARKKGLENENKSTESKTDTGKKDSGAKTSTKKNKSSDTKPAKNKEVSASVT